MANWQEKIRQSEEKLEIIKQEEARQTQEKERIRQEKLRVENEKRERKQVEGEKVKKELFLFLDQVEAKQLLEQIRDEVWRCGVITSDFRDFSDSIDGSYEAEYKLSYEYEEARQQYREVSFGGGQDSPRSTSAEADGKPYVWREEEALHVILKRRILGGGKGNNTQMRLAVAKGWNYWPLMPGADRYKTLEGTLFDEKRFTVDTKEVFNPVKNKEILEELILRYCIQGKKENRLPLQLEAKGKESIERLIPRPWYKRLF